MKFSWFWVRYKIEKSRSRLHAIIYKRFGIGRGFKSLHKFKNLEKGKPCFIIGNGPSLTVADLNYLAKNNVVSIASNKIYRCFDQTNWRPSYYTVADYLNAENDGREIDELNVIKFIPYSLKSFFRNKNNVFFFNELPAHSDNPPEYVPRFSKDAAEGFHVGHSVTHLNIQLANFLGCSPIYIIGMDGKYNIPDQRVDHKVFDAAVASDFGNHFVKNYYAEGEKWAEPRPDLIEIEHDLDNLSIQEGGSQIYNASRKTVIKSFKRINLSDIRF